MSERYSDGYGRKFPHRDAVKPAQLGFKFMRGLTEFSSADVREPAYSTHLQRPGQPHSVAGLEVPTAPVISLPRIRVWMSWVPS